MRKITQNAISAFLACRPFSSGNTTVGVTGSDRKTAILYLHGNAIARLYRGKYVEVTLADWPTRTTRERLNGIPGVFTYQHKGSQYLNGQKWTGDWTTIKLSEVQS